MVLSYICKNSSSLPTLWNYYNFKSQVEKLKSLSWINNQLKYEIYIENQRFNEILEKMIIWENISLNSFSTLQSAITHSKSSKLTLKSELGSKKSEHHLIYADVRLNDATELDQR